MIYNNLLLSAGGGIVDRRTLAEQSNDSTLFIGLGGTGIECLKKLKKEVYDHIRPDDDSLNPKYQHIQFLGIDSNDYANGLNRENEFLYLDGDINWWLEHKDFRKNIKQLDWMNDRLFVYEPGQPRPRNTTYGIRQLGRLLTFLNIQNIETIISKKINDALTGRSNNSKLYIHIIASVCGGIGSGSTLDICYIIQHILHELCIESMTRVCGFFFLPEVFYSNIKSNRIRRHLKINSFAFLKELDYCMNFELNGGEWSQDYFSFIIKCKNSPVNNAFLLGGNVEPDIDTYHFEMNNVVNYLLSSLMNLNRYEEYFLNHILFLDKQYAITQMTRKNSGAGYRYLRLGSTKAYVPIREINTYLVARLFEDFTETSPTNIEVESFINNTGLRYETLILYVGNDINNIPMFEVDSRSLIHQLKEMDVEDEYEVPCPQILLLMKKSHIEIACDIQQNAEKTLKFVFDNIQEKFEEFVKYQGKHPGYVSMLIENPTSEILDIVEILDGYLYQNKINIDKAYIQLALKRRDILSYLAILNETKVKRVKYSHLYVSAMHTYYMELLQIALYHEMELLLSKLKVKLIELNHDYWTPLSEITKNIAETFKCNINTVENECASTDKSSVEFVSIKDIKVKNWIDETVNSINKECLFRNFVKSMIERSDDWRECKDERIVESLVNQILTQELNYITKRSIDFFLGLKYSCNSQKELAEIVFRVFFDNMIKNSDKSIEIRNKTMLMSGGAIYIPEDSSVLRMAAEKLHRIDNTINVRYVYPMDSVYLYKLMFSVPLFAIQNIKDYYLEYMQSHDFGVHLYE